jgi:hypothetical protein
MAKNIGYSTIQMAMRYSHLVSKVSQASANAMDAFRNGAVLEIETDTRTDTGTIAGLISS